MPSNANAKAARATKARRSSRQAELRSFPKNELLIIGGVGLLIVVVSILLLLNSPTSSTPAYPLDVDLAAIPDTSVATPNQGQAHINEGAPHIPYETNPPASGPHYPYAADIGIYREPMPDELLVHNLEHGHIWLSYRDASDQEAIDILSELQRRNSGWVIVTHRPQNDTRIAAAAWTRLLKGSDLTREQLQAFIVRYQNRAPESIPG